MESFIDKLSTFFNSFSSAIHIVLGIFIFLVFFLARNKLSKGVLNLLSMLIFHHCEQKRESLKKSMEKPLAALFALSGAFIGIYINVQNTIILKAFKISVILIICWALVNYLSNNLFLLFHFGEDADNKLNTTAIKFISNILKILVIAFAVVMVISELGYNVNGLLTGIGVGGLALSLAAQDAVSNLISGFIIIFDKPFIVGDLIQTSSIQGYVEEVTMRSTKIRTLEDSVITVPNSVLTSDAVINISSMDKRLIDFDIGLVYSTTNELLKKCQSDIKAYLENNEKILPSPIRVNFTKLDNSSLNISVTCYTATADINEYLSIVSEINYKIKEIVENNGGDFAYPSSSIYIEKQ